MIAITKVGVFFEKLMTIADTGIQFVFGGMVNEGAISFFFVALLPLVFMSVLIGILKLYKSIAIHYQIFRFIVK